MSKIPSLIRSPELSDISFIYSSWLKSYKESDDACFSGHKYFLVQKKIIAEILEHSIVAIVCDPAKPGDIYSYAVYEILGEILVLHWIYTKYPFRGFGFAGDIIRAIYSNNEIDETMVITHRGVSYSAVKSKFRHLYKPELAFSKEIE
jgi:hypothetical protein